MLSAKEQIYQYVGRVRRRLRLATAARGLAVCCGAAFLLTILLVLLADAWRFTEGAVRTTTTALWLGIALALALFLIRPLVRRLSDARIARFVEEKHPELQDRLVTAMELADRSWPDAASTRLFEGLVAEDAVRRTDKVPPTSLIERRRILRPLVWAAGSVGLILLLGFFGPGVFRYGTRILWMGWAQAKANPLYELRVSPGDLVVGRDSDQEITAQAVGFLPDTARLFALHEGSPNWESAPMMAEEQGGRFRFLFLNIHGPIAYYVEANGVRSPRHRLTVIDVPRVERLEVRYRYPAYTGMKEVVETFGGDIVALRGTVVTVVVHTDVPSPGGRFVMDDGTQLSLKKLDDRALQASWTVQKDALYHVRLQDHLGREARASEEYLIQAVEDSAPTLRLARPGHDLQPTPVEEVVVAFEAEDDVRLSDLQLRYSVNGGPQEAVRLASGSLEREATGNHMLLLEDHGLVPGDLITFYGTVQDAAAHQTQSEMYFLQVRPFERSYTQAQAGGGGGGGNQDSTFLSQRQKEIISATWNVIRKKEQQRPDEVEEAGRVLASVQRALQGQAETLAMRIGRRELSGVNEEFNALVENLQKAAQAMEPAAAQLEKQEFEEALSPEQTALQHLLRAEALFRDIQVAFGNQGGGGGGSGNSGQDLADLFSLELDTNKNQYETLQEMGSGERGAEAEMDEAMRKLQELARRQENLSRQERENQKESMRAASRWEQEMLRREAEDLARRLEQLSKETNSSQVSQASRALSQAARNMQQAGSQSGSSGMSERANALERLREASNWLAGQRARSEEDTMRRLAENAEDLARQQEKISEEVRQTAESSRGGQRMEPSWRQALSQTINDKVKQLESLRNLERQINEASGRMADSQRKTAQQLRGASSSIQEERMADKIRQGGWLAQQGMWPTAAPIEKDLLADLRNLENRIKEAQRSLEAGGTEGKLQEALAAAERVRQGLENMGTRQPGSQEGTPGQGQEGATAQGDSSSGSRGGPRQAGTPGVPPTTRSGGAAGRFTGQYTGEAWNRGGIAPLVPGTPLTLEEQRQLEEQYRPLLQEAGDLRAMLADEPEFERLARDLVRSMQNLDADRFAGNPEQLERMRAQLVERWKDLELSLGRLLNQDKSDSVRLANQERVSEKYRSILEEYYRALSRSQR
ncbi:MAG: hypothetical protein A3H27_16680 [Acidobacteria bacterium RIFCSPLOWO2_02_FULL_59_13]|nr:MAG: hypothetical protein A3H27_16680 [Acidobacteria bacterium RIFCSPLOWO2_02_FULL_59_13]